MSTGYGTRYMPVGQFIKYCASLNEKTDERELEYYEKTGIMLPIARLIYPADYKRNEALWLLHVLKDFPSQAQWPEVERLFEKRRTLPQHYVDLQDEELIDAFDREMGHNPYLVRPTAENYKPWDSYKLVVPYGEGWEHAVSTAEHYYGYWQVHHLHYLHEFPDLYTNKVLLDNIPEEIKKRLYLPRAHSRELLGAFKGLSGKFDTLSFWITMHDRERKRTFAPIPVEHQVQHLNTSQFQAYQDRLISDARSVQARYELSSADPYRFLRELLDLYDEYQKIERFRLAEELRNDIIYQAQLIQLLTGMEWNDVAKELGKRATFGTVETFRHLDIIVKERDEAREVLTRYAKQYGNQLSKLNIVRPKRTFSENEIDEFLDYCEHEGFSILFTALSGMIATEETSTKKFRQVSVYINLKNLLTTIEFILRDFADRGGIEISHPSLNNAIRKVMATEKYWISIFVGKQKELTSAENFAQFLSNLSKIQQDDSLIRSENTYWARVFLIVSLSRNITVHSYPSDDWFYSEILVEILHASVYGLLYSWQLAKSQKWV